MNHAKDLLPKWKEGLRLEYETLTLRLPSGTIYTPDVVVWDGNAIHSLVETKGGHIHSPTSIQKFKEAKSAFPHLTFVFAQKFKDGWAIV